MPTNKMQHLTIKLNADNGQTYISKYNVVYE
jgi:hypothetical protein